jgi:hypothetical protein
MAFSDTQIITGLVSVVVATYATFCFWIVHRFDRLETKIDSLTVAVSRLEGAVYHSTLSERRGAGGEASAG